MKLNNYQEFLNEEKLNEAGFFGKALRSLSKWFAAPLNDFLKDIEKEGKPEEIIKSLKTYIQVSNDGIDKKLKSIKTKKELSEYLKDSIQGIYTALKGVQSTEKVGKTFFDEIFKKADKNLVKAMSYKQDKAFAAIDNYVDEFLIPNLDKIKGMGAMGESVLFEADLTDEEDKIDKETSELEKEVGDEKQEDKSEEIDDKTRKVVKGFLINIFGPILKAKAPEAGEEGDVKNIEIDGEVAIPTTDKSGVKVSVMRNLVSNATIDDLKALRNIIAKRQGIKDEGEMIKKWPLGR
jgi:hypothetical protein